MVGRQVLALVIGVRVPTSEHIILTTQANFLIMKLEIN